MKKIFILVSIFTNSFCLFGQNVSMLNFNTNFEGGNGFIEKISNDTVWITPDTRNITGDWFYWAVEVTSETSNDFVFCLPEYKIPAFGIAYSLDNGLSWNWSKQKEEKYIHSFKMHLPAKKPIRLSMGFPYTNSNWQNFVKQLDSDGFVMDTLCLSSKQEAVTLMLFGNNDSTKPKIVITARHHACEMMANYVMEGMISSCIDNEEIKHLLTQYDILFIPFVDYEGVQNGDQGKNRYPRDHNRDYSGKSLYTTTQAIREYLPVWAQDNLVVAIDLHCPGLVGKEHEIMHIVGTQFEEMAAGEDRFASHLAKRTRDKELQFDETAILKYGTSWNNDRSESQGDSFKTWIKKRFPLSKLACSFEIPYATNKGQRLSVKNLHEFGEAMMCAIADFLEKDGDVTEGIQE